MVDMRFFLFALLLVALFIGSYLIWGDYFEQWLVGEKAIENMRSNEGSVWLIAILLFITDVALPIPGTALLAILGNVYGPIVGGLIGCVGSFMAGATGYLVCYALGERAAVRLVGSNGLTRGRAFFDRAGGWTVALSRWMIILPELVSCMAGLTRMPPKRYFVALTCGVIPWSFAYAYVGWAGSDHPALWTGISAAVPVLLWPLAQMLLAKRANSNVENASVSDTPQ